MSTYNIREKFSYVMTTSSIDYVRNYNFNTSTVTDIPLIMSNSDEQTPITVYIKTSMPWIEVIDPTTGASVVNPVGNVVLPPSSSTAVLVKIDLPPNIESNKINNLKESIFLEIKSGSFKIEQPTQTTNTTNESTSNTNSTTVTNQESSDNTNQQRNSTDTNPQRMVVE